MSDDILAPIMPGPSDVDDYSSQYVNNLKKTEDIEALRIMGIGIDPEEDTSPPSHGLDPTSAAMAEMNQGGMDSRADVDILGAARQKTYGNNPEQATRSMVSTGIRNVADIPLSVGHGVLEGFQEASEAIAELSGRHDVGERFAERAGRLAAEQGEDNREAQAWQRLAEHYSKPTDVPNIFQAPDTATGEIASKLSQFLTGFAAGGRALKGWKVAGKVGQFAKSSVQGAISDFAFFDAQEDRLSNMIQEVPALQNPVTEFLAASPDDSQAMGRLKNAIEGLGFGAATEGAAKALGASLKVIKKVRAERAALAEADELLLLRQAAADEVPPTALEALGSPDRPLIEDISGKEVAAAGDDIANAISGVGARSADDNFYINFARIDSPDDVKEVIQTMANRNREALDQARRGEKMTFKEMQLNADQEDAWKILAERRSGEPLNAEQSVAARTLWATSGQKLTETAKMVMAAPTEENMFAFMKMLNVHNAIQQEVVAARTETARALASWRIPTGPKDLQLRQMEELIGYMKGGDKSVRELAAGVAKFSDAGLVRELETFVEKAPLAIARESVQEYWVMSLLSGPKTHMVNMMSNAMVALQQVYERGVAARIGRALGDDTGVQIGEGMALLSGGIGAIKDAFRLAGKAFKENQSGFYSSKIELPPAPAISAENWGLAKDGMFGKAVDVIGQTVRIPGRALMAEDEFFKTVGYRAELNALAYRQATREAAAGKISKDQIRERMVDIMENPTDALKIASVDHAAYSTFTNAPGKFVQGWLKLTRDVPALRFLTPFIKTPANIFNYTVAERSPLAPLFRSFREDIAAGGARQQLALARVSTSTAIMLAAGDLAFSGNLTGGGPPNQAERQTMMRGGWQPYSVKVGDQYFSYARTDPLGMTFGIAADLAEIVNNMDHDDQEVDADEAATYFVASIAGNVMSKSYMSGLSDFFEAASDPKRAALNYAKRFAGGFVPTGLAEVAKFNDPYMLETNSIIDGMKARVPGLSKDLPARRDLWGRAISYRSGMGAFYDAVSPIASRRGNPEPIDQEMLRLEAYVAAPLKKVTFDKNALVLFGYGVGENSVAVDLTRFPGAYSRYVQLAGNDYKDVARDGKGCMDYLNDVVTTHAPEYEIGSDGPEGGKAKFIESIITQYRRKALQKVLDEYPALREYLNEKFKEQPGSIGF